MPLTPVEALNKVVENRVPTLRLQSAIFLQQLYEQGRMATKVDTNINWDVEVGGGAATIEAITADGSITSTDNTVPANLRIGRYRVKHQFGLLRTDIKEAASRAPDELKNLFNNHVDRGLNYILRSINQLLFTGTGLAAAAEVVGLEKVLDDTFSYGGISPTTYPAWKALRSHNSGTPRSLSKNILLNHEELVKVNETDFDAIICSPSMGTKYNQLFDSIGGGSVVINGEAPNGFKRVELGHGYRTYQGRPIVEDPMCLAGQMIFLRMSDLTLYTFDMANDPAPMSQQEIEVASTKAWGMNINIAELPSMNSARRVFEMYVLPQFHVYTRKSVQAIQDLS